MTDNNEDSILNEIILTLLYKNGEMDEKELYEQTKKIYKEKTGKDLAYE